MFRALLVDDEKMILDLLAGVLGARGFEVVTATSAAQGTAILAAGERFDIVVTDLRMESPLAGFDVVKAADRAVPRPIVAILTAFPVPASDWKSAGADALFVKGVHTGSLPDDLRALVQHRQHRA
jgi:DNA-binding response OmpR family regulator